MIDTITLTREEIKEARKDLLGYEEGCDLILRMPDWCIRNMSYLDQEQIPAFCRLCKKLTQFAKGEEE